jgi:hypothetical protein
MKTRRIVTAVLGLLLVSAVTWAQTAGGTDASSSGSLWGATAIGGIGGAALAQAIKKGIHKIPPNLLGKKGTFSLSWITSFGVGVVAYLLFPAGRSEILSQAFSIFQGGATASALSSGIYKPFGNFLGLSSQSA